MKIALINGSPKAGKSNSGWLLEQLEKYIGENPELHSVAKALML